MAYDTLTAAQIAAGKALKEEILTKIKSNQDGFNTDIENLKQISVIDIFNIHISGDISSYSVAQIQSRSPIFKAPVKASITSFVFTLLSTSSSGTLEIDILKSTDNGINFSTLLNSPVELTGTAIGSLSGIVDFINAAAQDFNQNDLLKILITGVQVNQGDFDLSVYGEVA